MIKMIFKQLWNERKSNLFIWLELFVVSVFLWYAADALYVNYQQYKQPVGFDISHVYYVQMSSVPETSADYDTTTVHASQGGADILAVYDRLKQNPMVSDVCFTTMTHFHYMWCNQYATFKGDTMVRQGYVRFVDPANFRVFRVKEADGGSPSLLEKTLNDGKVVVTATVAKDFYGSARNARNKQICITDQGNQDSTSYVVGAVCEPQRYNEFNKYDYAYYKPVTHNELVTASASTAEYLPIFIRVKPSADNSHFADDFRKAMTTQLRVGNVYLKDVIPMSFYRTDQIRHYISDMKMYIAVIVFFLLNVLLGVVGTFWFRTQQRHAEIGLRMAMGASRKSVFSQLIGEGMALLLTSVVLAMIVLLNMVRLDVLTHAPLPLEVAPRIVFGFVATVVLEAAMIFVGISFPAWRAMHLHPADVLHEE